MSDLIVLPEGYEAFLRDLKARIRAAQTRAALAVNNELVLLYWQIGRDIRARQKEQGWGTKVVDRLCADLRREFPEIKGFSPRNLRYMQSFADAWPDESILQEALAKLTWYHNIALLEKVSTSQERLWYARQAIEHGWSRNVLVLQIESKLYQRQGKAITNFERALPKPQSDLAQQLLKDPYNFDFLTLGDEASERDLEYGLLDHVRKFLLELGAGFAFLGSQYHLEVADSDYYLDLLFYHVRLRCYVVIDLKMQEFQPEFSGKMNFYLAVVDDLLRHPDDAPSIGIILCKDKNRVKVEYALRNVSTPIGVSEFRLAEALPPNMQGKLPTIAELEANLSAAAEAEPEQNERKEDTA